MLLPGSLTAGSFLRDYWQKTSKFLPGASQHIEPKITSAEVAWLATQADVESRLITTQRRGDELSYNVEHGPFEEQRLTTLPSADWSLLVHDVEKHLPELRSWIASVEFVPDWRIDDLMISVAAPGGGVGPHVDNYDVFLCQVEGMREWRLSSPDATVVDPSSRDLALLQPFSDFKRLYANEGDVLYLPPGQPHWGIASEFCMTYSVGMRAPSKGELTLALDRIKANPLHAGLAQTKEDLDQLYYDLDLAPHEIAPGRIADESIARIYQQNLLDSTLDEQLVISALGTVVTDPKAWLAPEGMIEERAIDITNSLGNAATLTLHGMAKIAFFVAASTRLVFLNGHFLEVSAAQSEAVAILCAERRIQRQQIDAKLLIWLLCRGGFDV